MKNERSPVHDMTEKQINTLNDIVTFVTTYSSSTSSSWGARRRKIDTFTIHISFGLRADSCIIKSPNCHKRDDKKFYDKIDVDKSVQFLKKYMGNSRQRYAANDRRNLVTINDDHRKRNEELFWVRWCEYVMNTHFQYLETRSSKWKRDPHVSYVTRNS